LRVGLSAAAIDVSLEKWIIVKVFRLFRLCNIAHSRESNKKQVHATPFSFRHSLIEGVTLAGRVSTERLEQFCDADHTMMCAESRASQNRKAVQTREEG
jgi:hypothetical protein